MSAGVLHFEFHGGAYRSSSGGYVVYALGLSGDERGAPLYNAELRTPRRTIALATSVPLADAIEACQADHLMRCMPAEPRR